MKKREEIAKLRETSEGATNGNSITQGDGSGADAEAANSTHKVAIIADGRFNLSQGNLTFTAEEVIAWEGS